MNDSAPRNRPIRICLVLASKITADLLSREFAAAQDHLSVSAHHSYDSALTELSQTTYRILLTNLHLDGVRYLGLRLVSEALHAYPGLRAIVLGNAAGREDIVAAFRSGARGYLDERDATVATLLKAIQCVDEGQVWASSEQLNDVLDEFAAGRRTLHAPSPLEGLLTEREREVADLVMRGKSNKEIAFALQVSEHTVKNHLVKIFAKLRVTSRTAAIFQIYERLSSAEPFATHHSAN